MFVRLLSRALPLLRPSSPRHLALAHLETTSLLVRTCLQPGNLMLQNLLRQLEKIREETEADLEIGLNSLALFRCITNVITHTKQTS